MNISTVFKIIVFATGVFTIYIIFVILLKVISIGFPSSQELASFIKQKDLITGLMITSFVTVMHIVKSSKNSK